MTQLYWGHPSRALSALGECATTSAPAPSIPGGVRLPVRAFRAVGGAPRIHRTRGAGARGCSTRTAGSYLDTGGFLGSR